MRYWLFELGRVDPSLLDVASKCVRPGHIVWDIGANVGLFSLAAATLAAGRGKVLAIEPDSCLAALLLKTAALRSNAGIHLDVLSVAASDQVGLSKFNVAQKGRSSNFLDSVPPHRETGGIQYQTIVPTVTLDWLLDYYAVPDFVKIDVEGAEDKVLRGATRILTEIRPAILCEVYSHNEPEVTALLKNHRYVLHDADASKNNVRKRALNRAAFNTLAFPEEKGPDKPGTTLETFPRGC